MTPDEKRWAEALHLEREHGDGALAWVAERAVALERAGDEAGVGRMREIWARLLKLLEDGRNSLREG